MIIFILHIDIPALNLQIFYVYHYELNTLILYNFIRRSNLDFFLFISLSNSYNMLNLSVFILQLLPGFIFHREWIFRAAEEIWHHVAGIIRRWNWNLSTLDTMGLNRQSKYYENNLFDLNTLNMGLHALYTFLILVRTRSTFFFFSKGNCSYDKLSTGLSNLGLPMIWSKNLPGSINFKKTKLKQ